MLNASGQSLVTNGRAPRGEHAFGPHGVALIVLINRYVGPSHGSNAATPLRDWV